MAKTSVTFKNAAGTTVEHDAHEDAVGGQLRPVEVIGAPDSDNTAHVEAWGQLHVTQGPATLFFDDFSTAADAELWTTPAGTAPQVTGGRLVPVATLSTYNFTRSVDLLPNGVGFVDARFGVQLETAVGTGAGRFWGLGTQAGTPTASRLVQDGVGFEVDQATGDLLAVTYNGGTRTTIATLTRPTDGLLHRYAVVTRVTRTYWFIDGYSVAVATIPFPDIAVADLPVAVVRQNAASLANSPVFSITGIFAADTNRDASMIADSKIPARRMRLAGNGGLVLGTATAGAPATVTVGTTAIDVLAANPLRRGFVLVNSGATTIYLRYDGGAPTTALYTMRLDPGDRYVSDPPTPSGLLRGIGSADGGTLLVTEMS